ncbi:hypothetical protein [Pacificoceanicola onchidii]|uniref:hypothetical protein n=1 Tax=Pacificoceanicola onchidii TaxID=2562685 RepID=UPI0010A60880|nr:hypothetical protein [Pacificoceanicola onchidii]
MEIERFYLSDPKIILVRKTGAMTAKAVLEALEAHRNSPHAEHSNTKLIDLSQVDSFEMDFSAVNRISSDLTRYYISRNMTIILYAPTQVSFGMARMYQSVAEARFDMMAEIYDVESEALARIGAPDATIDALIARNGL